MAKVSKVLKELGKLDPDNEIIVMYFSRQNSCALDDESDDGKEEQMLTVKQWNAFVKTMEISKYNLFGNASEDVEYEVQKIYDNNKKDNK
jgi:hypothetical protein